MEHVALTDQQLTYLAREDPKLKPKSYSVVPCDGFPKSPVKDMTRPKGYIVNTDPHDQPVSTGLLCGLKEVCVK